MREHTHNNRRRTHFGRESRTGRGETVPDQGGGPARSEDAFDALSKGLASSTSRRGVLRILGRGTASAFLFSLAGSSRAFAGEACLKGGEDCRLHPTSCCKGFYCKNPYNKPLSDKYAEFICYQVAAPPGKKSGEDCKTREECDSHNCRNGKCKARVGAGGRCDGEADCFNQYPCRDGVCVAPGPCRTEGQECEVNVADCCLEGGTKVFCTKLKIGERGTCEKRAKCAGKGDSCRDIDCCEGYSCGARSGVHKTCA